MDTTKIIEKVADGILHLQCKGKANCFVNDFTDKRAKEHEIQKNSILIVNSTACHHKCEPSKECLEHFKRVCFVIKDMRDEKEFTRKLQASGHFTKQGLSASLFTSYEDAYSWSVAKLAAA